MLTLPARRELFTTHYAQRTMKPSDAVLSAHLGGESVLLEMDGKRYFRLNESGQVIWRRLEAGASQDQLVRALLEEFDVDEATARREVEQFLSALQSAGLLND